ncbi:helix-turn-helix domain-containing protein [Selenomonas ruminantium]|uniref:DNA-binding transcriptional regulator, XRE-family HTH domain n=1 Tax=Selenomonas ruminantium TaxID=971 RepID=A0A1I0V1Q5_SELRU|nr:helix-turn-helix transcriptional regulator [Selenomonas ruminantium]SFA70279.1 DNA-binding transcriptional regulator, XRE-family HTH domain [Selenomonas ruminantium]
MVNNIIGNFFMRRLPALRRERELTRKEIAKGVGVTLGKYDKWEAGKVLPKSEDIARLARFYELSIDDFLGLTAEESEAIHQRLLEDAEKLPPQARNLVLEAMQSESHH